MEMRDLTGLGARSMVFARCACLPIDNFNEDGVVGGKLLARTMEAGLGFPSPKNGTDIGF
jgi:hypothetical protein